MPLSMIRLQGLRAHGTQQKSTVFAYADDVTILVTSQEDVRTVGDSIACYEKANGATLNVAKSSALGGGHVGHCVEYNGHTL